MSTPTTGRKAPKKAHKEALAQMMRLKAGVLKAARDADYEKRKAALEAQMQSEDFMERAEAADALAVLEHATSKEALEEEVTAKFQKAIDEGAYAHWTDADWMRVGIDPPKRAAQAKKPGKQDVADWIMQQPKGKEFLLSDLRDEFGISADNTLRAGIKIASKERTVEDDGGRPVKFTIL